MRASPADGGELFLECDYTVLQFVLANENTSFLLELRELCQVSCTLLWLNAAIYFTIWPIQMIDKRCISAELSTKKQWNNLDWNASIQWESSKKCWRVTFKTRVTFFMYNKMYITANWEDQPTVVWTETGRNDGRGMLWVQAQNIICKVTGI